MEKSTPLGLLIGFSMMVGVLFVGESDVALMEFVDPPAIMMVFGGALAVVMVGFPLHQVLRVFRVVRKLFVHRADDPEEVIDQIVEMAEVARKNGLLALEQKAAECKHPLLELGIQLTIDGNRPETIEQILADRDRGRGGPSPREQEGARTGGALRPGVRHDRHAAGPDHDARQPRQSRHDRAVDGSGLDRHVICAP